MQKQIGYIMFFYQTKMEQHRNIVKHIVVPMW